MAADVIAVHLSVEHSFSKRAVDGVELVEGIGVRGDAHSGSPSSIGRGWPLTRINRTYDRCT